MATLEENIRQANSDFQAIKEKIVESGIEIAEGTKTEEYAVKVSKVYEKGKQDEYDAFWDEVQEYGNKKSYLYAFSGVCWSQKIYEGVKYSFGKPTSVQAMFRYNTKITDTVHPIDCTNAQSLSQMFEGAEKLTKIRTLTLKSSHTFVGTFAYCSVLEELDIAGIIGNAFDIHYSTKLSKASITSIINALSTTTSGLTVTLSQEAVNNAFTTEEWEALKATRTNWTISLYKG